MIKLFWNTHNQKKPNSLDKKIREKEEFASILSSNNNDINFLISKLEEFIIN